MSWGYWTESSIGFDDGPEKGGPAGVIRLMAS